MVIMWCFWACLALFSSLAPMMANSLCNFQITPSILTASKLVSSYRSQNKVRMRCRPRRAHLQLAQAESLLLATSKDIASVTLAKTLLSNTSGWKSGEKVENGQTWHHESSGASLWWITESFLHADNLDKRWTSATERKPSDVIFLSRHAAASGKPSLTVHPIGNPLKSAEPRYGGKQGVCCPPSSGIAPIFRELCARTKSSPLEGIFDVSLEATHHGPYLETPSMFIEIGSTEEHWDNVEAAKVWASTLSAYLNLDGNEKIWRRWESFSDEEKSEASVVVGLGGGHYAPKHGDLARQQGAWMGHILASYNFDFEGNPSVWQDAVMEAIYSTEASFPGCKVICHLDKKSFKGAHRAQLIEFLNSKKQQHVLKSNELSFSPIPLNVL
mmetsp:Transcript_38722/g.51027  ORF Transcript_38722/g.51027 Transcript_38722/m.51027 type:complete len:386 (-) Transcript_38722:147-1304(-)